MNSTGRILPRSVTGTCAKHQRKLSRIVKKSVHMGLISYRKGFSIHNPFPIYEANEEAAEKERLAKQHTLQEISEPYLEEYTEGPRGYSRYSSFLKDTDHPVGIYFEEPEAKVEDSKIPSHINKYVERILSDDLAKKIGKVNKKFKGKISQKK